MAGVRQIRDLVDELQPFTSGQSAQKLIRFVTDRSGHDHRYAIDFSKLERELSWRLKAILVDGLRWAVQWYLDERVGQPCVVWCKPPRATRVGSRRVRELRVASETDN